MKPTLLKPLLATLLIALALGLTACSESDDTVETGDGESTSLTIDAEDNSMSYESGDTSISVDAEGGDDGQ